MAEEKGKRRTGEKTTAMVGTKVSYKEKDFGETNFVVISPTTNLFFSFEVNCMMVFSLRLFVLTVNCIIV